MTVRRRSFEGERSMKKSTQVAVGGLSAAICLLLMFMTGMVPLSSYVFPAFSGVVLIAVREENGTRTAFLVFVVTSLLALMMVPDREAVLLFVMLMGYYPMVKPFFDRFKFPLSLLIKLVFCCVIIIAFYYATIYVLGVPDLLNELERFGEFAAYAGLALGIFCFFMYDFLLTQVLELYMHWLRPKILRYIH